MDKSGYVRFKEYIRKSLGLILILLAILIQSVVYFSVYPIREGYIDWNDAAVVFGMALIIFLVILLFRRSIEHPLALNLLQLGWAIVIIALVHTGLIQLVDLFASPPLQIGILNDLIQQFHDGLTVVLGGGLVFIILGLYVWVSDIQSREKRFHSIISAMPVGVAVIDSNGKTVLCNEKLVEILGIQNDEILGTNLWDILKVNASDVVRPNEDLYQIPSELDITLENNKKIKHLTIAITAVSQNNPSGQIVVLSDVTTRRMAEEEREQQRRVTALYSSLLTHDIGNDLQAVLGYIEAANLLFDKDPGKAKTMLRSGLAAGGRMSNLINTFRIESEHEQIELIPMLRRVAKEAEVANMGLQVHLDIDADTEDLQCPGVWLLPKAIENLFRNAAQHGGENPEVFVHVTREHESFVIQVMDNGPGIPADIKENIFNRSDPQRESGLGLYLTKQIITACGGAIEIDESSTAKGAAYRITLPVIE
ncbi:MAG: PAS domain-containing sensor histidine kinase [Promethearchaeota archaeon]